MREKWVKWFLLSLGLLALIVGVISLIQRNTFLPAEAVITKIESEYNISEDRYDYTVYVNYSAGGQRFKDAKLGYYQDGFEEGKEIEIRYNPDNPAQISGATPGFSIYLTIIGIILLGLGVYMCFQQKRKEA